MNIIKWLSYVTRYDRNFGVVIKANHNLGFNFNKKSYITKFFMLIGFLKPFQLDNDNFNKNIIIISDCDVFCHDINQNSQIQNLILDLFALGVYSLRCDGKTLSLFYETKFRLAKAEQESKIMVILPKINDILGALPSAKLPLNKVATSYDKVRRFSLILLILGILCYFIDPSSSIERLISNDLLYDVCKYVIPIFLILLAAPTVYFAGTSRATIVLFSNVFLILPNIVIWGYVISANINLHFDTSIKDNQYLTIIEHTILINTDRQDTKTITYDLKAINNNSNITYKLLSDRDLYDRTNIGSKVLVTLRNGFLGYKWIEKQSL